MAAIESGRSERRLTKILKKHVSSLAERLSGLCPSDGVPLRDGKCPVCRFERQPEPEPELEPVHDMPEAERKFWRRYDAQLREREREAQARATKTQPAVTPKSRAEQASAYLVGGQLTARGD